MKTYKFNFCKYTVTVIIEKKTYATAKEEPNDEIKMEEKKTCMPGIPTLYTCSEEYIESQRGKLSESTLKGYYNIIDNHLDPITFQRGINELNKELIQKAFDVEIEKGLSKKTLKGYWSFLKKVFTEYDRTDLCDLDIRFEKEITE